MAKPNYIAINRDQLAWETVDLERSIAADHSVRAIWALSERFDLSAFEQEVNNEDGGRPCWEPRLLLCVWVYGYTQGIASARALERMMAYEPGLRWLCGAKEVNYHTLADFRMSHKSKLEEMMIQLLAILDEEKLIDLETIAHDGTKIRAVASRSSLRREGTLRERAKKARRVVRELDRAAAQEPGSERVEARKEAAERRAAEERVRRMEASLRKLKREQEAAGASKRHQVRVSWSEPEARKMLQPDGGFGPSYNVQVSTDVKHRIIVGIQVCDQPVDAQLLKRSLATVRRWCRRKVTRVLADGGYTSRENVETLAAAGVELIAPWKPDAEREAGALASAGRAAKFAGSAFQAGPDGVSLVCPTGQSLRVVEQRKHHGQPCLVYEAEAAACAACAMRDACCGAQRPGPRRVERVQESPAMQAYLKRMQTPDMQQLYKKRSEVAEFPHLWIKAHWKLRRFSVRGKLKAGKEAIWAAIAYNIQQWIRLKWTPATA